jgi:hypothetical protein
MIDLYSDTVTQPTPGMRQAMAQAVGPEMSMLLSTGQWAGTAPTT